MAKIKYTKGELKRQRDNLEQFSHYLPTLILKKQQLQMKIFEVRKYLSEVQSRFDQRQKSVQGWVGLLADTRLKGFQERNTDEQAEDISVLKAWLVPDRVEVSAVNIAGADVPQFKEARFPTAEYDYYAMPFWVDKGLEELRELISLLIETAVIQKGIAILQKELRTTTQRVNLFEKVKIPECQENIRRIRIYLGDQQSNAVGISKVAKKKIEIKNQQQAALV